MHFSVHKKITRKKQSPFKGLINVLILIIAIPVIIIAAISLSFYFIFLWLKDKIIKEDIVEQPEDHYHLELDLIHNNHVHIMLIEDELDIELTKLNEAWQENVYDEETCLYRVRTAPLIPALEGCICCFYYKEQNDGLLLQALPDNKDNTDNTINTQLIFLGYQNLNVSVIDEMGPFFLYNDNKNAHLIHGFNKKEKMILELLSYDREE